MYLWCICGEEGDLHVLLFHHLEAPLYFSNNRILDSAILHIHNFPFLTKSLPLVFSKDLWPTYHRTSWSNWRKMQVETMGFVCFSYLWWFSHFWGWFALPHLHSLYCEQPFSSAAKATMSLIINIVDFLNQKRCSKQVSEKYCINHERTKRQLNNGPCPKEIDSLRRVRHL